LGLAGGLVVTLEQLTPPADFVHVTNKITYKRKRRRTTTSEETCMGAVKESVSKACRLRKASVRYSVTFMTLQRFYKILEKEIGSKFYIVI
jgi:hypothetical protein